MPRSNTCRCSGRCRHDCSICRSCILTGSTECQGPGQHLRLFLIIAFNAHPVTGFKQHGQQRNSVRTLHKLTRGNPCKRTSRHAGHEYSRPGCPMAAGGQLFSFQSNNLFYFRGNFAGFLRDVHTPLTVRDFFSAFSRIRAAASSASVKFRRSCSLRLNRRSCRCCT